MREEGRAIGPYFSLSSSFGKALTGGEVGRCLIKHEICSLGRKTKRKRGVGFCICCGGAKKRLVQAELDIGFLAWR